MNTDSLIDSADFEVSDIRPPSPGGQQVGTPHSHIKVLHKLTGIYAVCMSERSQHRNKTIAWKMVECGLSEMLGKQNLTATDTHSSVLVEAYTELVEAVRQVVEDGVQKTSGPYAMSKNNQCVHKRYGYEGCENCIDEHLSTALNNAKAAIAALNATKPAAQGWQPIETAPTGKPIKVRMPMRGGKWWEAVAMLNERSDEGHWTDGDSILHYNGSVLVAGFKGPLTHWMTLDSLPTTGGNHE